jgi:hypothetical protein
LNLTDYPIHSTMGLERISITYSSKTAETESSNTLGRPRPIQVLGRGLGLASSLHSVSEYSSTRIQGGIFEMRCNLS